MATITKRENGKWQKYCALEDDKIKYSDGSVICNDSNMGYTLTLDHKVEEAVIEMEGKAIVASCSVK